VSLLTRGERLSEPGPWDEMPVWLIGTRCLDAPLREHHHASVSFGVTGYHVLRGVDPGCFSTFRCGSTKDRFGQLDMLHVDVFWRGLNVLADGGSYLYNGPEAWHHHFTGTASHNSVVVDDRDQALHFRRFKFLYWTKAVALRFEDTERWALAAGEHYGYCRHDGSCVHRRSVLFAKDELWVVVDTITGTGRHAARLQWLCGDFPHAASPARGRLSLSTGAGDFGLAVYGIDGEAVPVTVHRGEEDPSRGWLSRHYGVKLPVPSLAAAVMEECPITLISVLGTGEPSLTREGPWFLASAGGNEARFGLREGLFRDVRVARGSATR